MQSGALIISMGRICFNEPPTLDAVLGGMAFATDRDGKSAPLVPEVAKKSEVPMASRAILIGHTKTKLEPRIRSFSRHVRANPDSIAAASDKSWRLDIQNTDYGKPAMTINPVHTITGVVFLARCDPDVVLARFEENPYMGTSRKDYGAIDSVHWVPLDDHEDFGIVGNGSLLRPVPQSMAATLSPDLETKTVFGFWKSPYHPECARRAGLEPEPVTYPTRMFSVGDLGEALAYACP